MIKTWEEWHLPPDHPVMQATQDALSDSKLVGAWIDRRRLLSCFVTIDCDRWHLSIAHPSRHPTWDEIHEARYRFIPDDKYMMLPLPPKDIYVNVHAHCFHLYEAQECKTIWMMDQM